MVVSYPVIPFGEDGEELGTRRGPCIEILSISISISDTVSDEVTKTLVLNIERVPHD